MLVAMRDTFALDDDITSRAEAQAGDHPFPQLPSRGGVVTNEQVNALRGELGI
jgi:hypothetical protein